MTGFVCLVGLLWDAFVQTMSTLRVSHGGMPLSLVVIPMSIAVHFRRMQGVRQV